MRKDNHITISA